MGLSNAHRDGAGAMLGDVKVAAAASVTETAVLAVAAARDVRLTVLEAHKESTVVVDARPRGTRDRAIVLVGLVALLASPLVVALIGLRHPSWHPIWDLALTEIQLRDVGTIHTPLTGMYARVGSLSEPGNHPGPLGFYMMFPAYRLFGSTSWAMQVAAVSVHVAAIATTLWLCWRRRRFEIVLATAVVLAFLMRAFGPEALTQAWNPYLPVLWWVAFVVAVWLVVCGGVRILPVAVFAGSFCVQNHASYVVPVAGLTTLALAGVWFPAYRHRSDRQSAARTTKWTLIALAVGIAVWLPSIIDQLSGEGNLGILWRDFQQSDREPLGFGEAFDVLLVHLNPWRLLSDGIFSGVAISGSKFPGALLLATWGVTTVIAMRLRHAALIRLHAVLAVALVLALVAISRLDFAFWSYWYLLLWVWGILGVLLLGVGCTLAVLVQRRLEGATLHTMTRWACFAVAGAALAFSIVFAVEAIDVDYDRRDSTVLDALVPQTVSALGSKREATYFVRWDEVTTGAIGRGLMNDLDRRGYDVRAAREYRAEVRPHRVMEPEDADAVIAVVGGQNVATWRAQRGVRQIAFVDLPTADRAKLAAGFGGTAVFVAPPREH